MPRRLAVLTVCSLVACGCSTPTNREVGESITDALFSEGRIAENYTKTAAASVRKEKLSTEETKKLLACYVPTLDMAIEHGDPTAIRYALSLMLTLRDKDDGFDRAPGVGDALRPRLPAIRALLAVDDAAVKWYASLVILEIGEDGDLDSVGAAYADQRGGGVIRMMVEARRAELRGTSGQDLMMESMAGIVGLIGSDDPTDRGAALRILTFITTEHAGKTRSVAGLLFSDDADERAAGLHHVRELAKSRTDLDADAIERWVLELKKRAENDDADAEGKAEAKAPKIPKVKTRFTITVHPPAGLPTRNRHELRLVRFRHAPAALEDTSFAMMESLTTVEGGGPWSLPQAPELAPGPHLYRVLVDNEWGCHVVVNVGDDGASRPDTIDAGATARARECDVVLAVRSNRPPELMKMIRIEYIRTVDGMSYLCDRDFLNAEPREEGVYVVRDKRLLLSGAYSVRIERSPPAKITVRDDGSVAPAEVEVRVEK